MFNKLIFFSSLIFGAPFFCMEQSKLPGITKKKKVVRFNKQLLIRIFSKADDDEDSLNAIPLPNETFEKELPPDVESNTPKIIKYDHLKHKSLMELHAEQIEMLKDIQNLLTEFSESQQKEPAEQPNTK